MFDTLQGVRNGTLCLSKAGLDKGTNPNTIKTVAPNGATIDFAIQGLMYSIAEADNIAMNALATQPVLTTCLYAVQVSAAGAYSLKKGPDILNSDIDAGNAVLHWPLPDAARAIIGYIKIKLTVAATFTSGSTDLRATNVTATYYDVFAPPVAPLLS